MGLIAYEGCMGVGITKQSSSIIAMELSDLLRKSFLRYSITPEMKLCKEPATTCCVGSLDGQMIWDGMGRD